MITWKGAKPSPRQGGSSVKEECDDEVMCTSLKRRNMSERMWANIATLRNGRHYCRKASNLTLLIIFLGARQYLRCCPLILVHWYSFCWPQEDDRLSQPHLVLNQWPTGIKFRTRRLLGDGQTEPPGVPAESGCSDALLRRMLPYLTWPLFVTLAEGEGIAFGSVFLNRAHSAVPGWIWW